MEKYSINWNAAPKQWKSFARWHKLACKGDPLSAEERFIKEGGVMPEKVEHRSHTQVKKKK